MAISLNSVSNSSSGTGSSLIKTATLSGGTGGLLKSTLDSQAPRPRHKPNRIPDLKKEKPEPGLKKDTGSGLNFYLELAAAGGAEGAIACSLGESVERYFWITSSF